MTTRRELCKKILQEARRTAEDDRYGTRALLDLADRTKGLRDHWKTMADGNLVEDWVAASVDACRERLYEIKGILVAKGTGPGLDQAHEEWLAAREMISPLIDEFPHERG